MAQTTTFNDAGARSKVEASNLAVPITATLTEGTLLEILSLNGIRRLWASFAVTVHDFNEFVVYGKIGADGPWVSLASTAAHYTSPGGIIVGASGDLTALAAGATGWIAIDTTGLTGIRIRAKSASASGTLVDTYANGSN